MKRLRWVAMAATIGLLGAACSLHLGTVGAFYAGDNSASLAPVINTCFLRQGNPNVPYRIATEKFTVGNNLLQFAGNDSSDPRLTGPMTAQLKTILDETTGVGTAEGTINIQSPRNNTIGAYTALLNLQGTLTGLGVVRDSLDPRAASENAYTFEGYLTGSVSRYVDTNTEDPVTLPAAKVAGNFIGLYTPSFFRNDDSQFMIIVGNDLLAGLDANSVSNESVSSVSLADVPAAKAFLDKYAPSVSADSITAQGGSGNDLNTALIRAGTSPYNCIPAPLDD